MRSISENSETKKIPFVLNGQMYNPLEGLSKIYLFMRNCSNKSISHAGKKNIVL